MAEDYYRHKLQTCASRDASAVMRPSD